jgi:hypothetical protein
MSINSLPYRVYNELAKGFKAKGRPRKRRRENIKDTLQQDCFTINDTTRQARTKILKIPLHQISREQQQN